jgi:urease accessory protein
LHHPRENYHSRQTGAVTAPPARATYERTAGLVDLELGRSADGATTVRRAFQSGAGRVRFPRRGDRSALEAIVMNTAGGLTGGDRFAVRARLDGGRAVITTQASEKVYRSEPEAAPAALAQRLEVGDGAAAKWLPQPTIVFDGARIVRDTEIDVAGAGSVVAVEALILGRTAMGEALTHGTIIDRLRVRRDGRLIFADTFRLAGDGIAALAARPAGLGGARAIATLCVLSAGAEASATAEVEAMLGRLREIAEAAPADVAASARNGMLVARVRADQGDRLVASIAANVKKQGLGPQPRPWAI